MQPIFCYYAAKRRFIDSKLQSLVQLSYGIDSFPKVLVEAMEKRDVTKRFLIPLLSFKYYVLVFFAPQTSADSHSSNTHAANTTLPMACAKCLIHLKELHVLIIFVHAVSALFLLKRRMSLLRRYTIPCFHIS